MKYFIQIILYFLLSYSPAFGGEVYEIYDTHHFRIYSNMDPKYITFIKNNLEAYYSTIFPKYFSRGFEYPLIIFYSKTIYDSKELLRKTGFDDDIEYGVYKHHIPPVLYTHREMEDGRISGWGTLFHEVTHHFIHVNYGDCPDWFNEGLACFLGEQSRIVNGHLQIGYPNPWREQILRDSIKNGVIIDVKTLVSLSDREFRDWDIGYHVARAFFYWLYEMGQLNNYLTKVQQKGYRMASLHEILPYSREKINKQFLAFIKENCYAGAYVKDARDLDNPTIKKEVYLKALAIKPDYQQAQLELAIVFYKNHELEKSRDYLLPILSDKNSKCYLEASKYMGDTYYISKNYAEALKYYKQAWDYSDYYEYKYDIAYSIGCCYHFLGDKRNAKQWYKYFLQYDWEPKSHLEMIKYAEDYK